MRAIARSIRIAPKKANLIAKMVRGMTVEDALASLRRTPRRAARLIEVLILSARANAEQNDRQNPDDLVIHALTVNQGKAYRRGVPMARGRYRHFRKFLSHIEVKLGVKQAEEHGTQQHPSGGAAVTERAQGKKKKMTAGASQKKGKSVKSSRSSLSSKALAKEGSSSLSS